MPSQERTRARLIRSTRVWWRATAHNDGVVRLFTTLSAEATDPDHPAHKHFVTRYERVRASVRDGLAAEVRQGRLESSIDPELARASPSP